MVVDDFFDGDRFVPLRVAQLLISDKKFITFADTRETFYYSEEEGTYLKAEPFVFAETQRILEEETNSTRQKEIFNCIKNATYAEREDYEPPVNLILLENGIYDFQEGKALPFTNKYFFQNKIPIKYDAAKNCPKINTFLSQIVVEADITALKEFIAYCLWRRRPIEKSFMFIGEGRNGKSTLIALVKAFLGAENISALPLQRVQDKFAISALYGKLANLCADISAKAFYDTSYFKQMGDTLTVEKKFRDSFETVFYTKMVFSANRIPEVIDDTDAFFRRWEIFNFPNIFTEGNNANANLIDELICEEELSGLLNEVLALLPQLLKRGRFLKTTSSDDVAREWKRLSNSLEAFVMDKIDQDAEGTVPKDEFFARYSEHCQKMNYPTKSKLIVGKELAKIVPVTTSFPKVDGKQKESWRGIRFRDLETKDIKDEAENIDLTRF